MDIFNPTTHQLVQQLLEIYTSLLKTATIFLTNNHLTIFTNKGIDFIN